MDWFYQVGVTEGQWCRMTCNFLDTPSPIPGCWNSSETTIFCSPYRSGPSFVCVWRDYTSVGSLYICITSKARVSTEWPCLHCPSICVWKVRWHSSSVARQRLVLCRTSERRWWSRRITHLGPLRYELHSALSTSKPPNRCWSHCIHCLLIRFHNSWTNRSQTYSITATPMSSPSLIPVSNFASPWYITII